MTILLMVARISADKDIINKIIIAILDMVNIIDVSVNGCSYTYTYRNLKCIIYLSVSTKNSWKFFIMECLNKI